MSRIRHWRNPQAGLTIIEATVVLGLSSVVFGLITTALILTQRESDRLTQSQLLRQEAVLIAQSVERVLRYRVDLPDLDLEGGFASGGAGQDEPAAGGLVSELSTSTLPASIALAIQETAPVTSPTLVTSDVASTPTRAVRDRVTSPGTELRIADRDSTPAAPAVRDSGSTGARESMVPPSIQPILRDTTTTAELQGMERFSADELSIYSLARGSDPTRVVQLIRNAPGMVGQPSRAYVELRGAGRTFSPGTSPRPLGHNPDKFQSQVSFRYANQFTSSGAVWERESRQVPILVEYTVRVWPIGSGSPSFEDAHSADGMHMGFQITSGVRLR